MKHPLTMYEGGPDHIEHMISRLDSIHDELVSFERVLNAADAQKFGWQFSKRDTVTGFLADGQAAVEEARTHLKRLRKRIKARRAS